jgi:TPR repeat protein
MRTTLSALLAACVTGAALCIPQHLEAQEEVAQLERDCDAGKAQACVGLGDHHTRGAPLTEDDWRRAASFYEQGCNLGDRMGCWHLGRIYEHGYGVTQDSARAVLVYQQACDLELSSGCAAGARLTAVTGASPDSTRYPGFLEKGCDLGRGDHCLVLGLMYDVGRRVPKDTARANELFKMGCMFENERACELIRR